jgi:hypothetical protein
MATVLEECTTQKQPSVVRFFVGKNDSIQKIFIKKYFVFMIGTVCRVKRFSLGVKRFADEEEVEMEVRKWLRKQSKDFYATDFDALVKDRTGVSVSVEDMSRNKCFPVSNITCFAFYIHL